MLIPSKVSGHGPPGGVPHLRGRPAGREDAQAPHPARVFLTQMSPLQSRVAAHARAEIQTASIPVLQTEVIQRAAYQALHFTGLSPSARTAMPRPPARSALPLRSFSPSSPSNSSRVMTKPVFQPAPRPNRAPRRKRRASSPRPPKISASPGRRRRPSPSGRLLTLRSLHPQSQIPHCPRGQRPKDPRSQVQHPGGGLDRAAPARARLNGDGQVPSPAGARARWIRDRPRQPARGWAARSVPRGQSFRAARLPHHPAGIAPFLWFSLVLRGWRWIDSGH